MISFTPSGKKDGLMWYEAKSNDEFCGRCGFTSDGYLMKIVEMDCEDDIVKEGLLRSTLNYCANDGCYLACVGEELFAPAFSRLGFSLNKLTVEIPEALTTSCCSCNKNSE